MDLSACRRSCHTAQSTTLVQSFGQDGDVVDVKLIVPVKRLSRAKTRLAGVMPRPGHDALVLAMAADTVAAALGSPLVARVLVVAEVPEEVELLATLGAEVIADRAGDGLNAALHRGSLALRAADPGCVVGALQADLPAVQPDDLTAAITEADGTRVFCADRHGTGTSLLLSAPGEPLDPHFGSDSALAHAASGATALRVAAPGLRADVDTPGDLAYAHSLGLGAHTMDALPCERSAV